MVLIGLHLRDFALAERADLELLAGLTVITGETGAGKSVLIQALAFALGAAPDLAMIRPEAQRAQVEALFDLSDAAVLGSVEQVLLAAEIPFDGELIIRRIVSRPQNGRGRLSARLRINDHAAPIATLREIAPMLADIHGQRDNLSVLRPQQQLFMLDRFAGLDSERGEIAGLVRRLQAVDRQLADLSGNERERARRIALLQHEAEEIEAAGLSAGEDDALHALHTRLVHAQRLAQEADTARVALETDTLADALSALRRMSAMDPGAEPLAGYLEAAAEYVAEAQRELREYADRLSLDAGQLSEVEERLALIADMQRRYGDTVAEIIAYGERAAQEAMELDQSAQSVDELSTEAETLAAEAAVAGAALSDSRRRAAQVLLKQVQAECDALRLANARLELRFEPLPAAGASRGLDLSEDADARIPQRVGADHVEADGSAQSSVGFDQTGIERVEMLVSFNPESPTQPLRRVASGGETARLTLALKAALGETDDIPLLVFDEVDVGLGGRSGGIIGDRLRRLAERRQVICITHLPQVAARAKQHVTVAKSADGDGTRVDVRTLDRDATLVELADMLGGDSIANRASAAELLRDAAVSA